MNGHMCRLATQFAHLTLLFMAEQGEVTITASSAERLSGTFTALGRGFFLDEETVEVAGSFAALLE